MAQISLGLRGAVVLLGLVISQLALAAHLAPMRNARYCEIVLSQSLTRFVIYSTWGFNHCPSKQWAQLTEENVKQTTNATHVHLSGPRYWLIDGAEKTDLIRVTPKNFDGITLGESGVLRLNFFDLLKAKQPYRIHHVERQTTWIYQADKPVYELISPQGQVFVMQSYSTQKAPQTLQSLATLGKRLHLPAGWAFKQGILRTTTSLPTVNNIAQVLQDEFANTYQLASHDFLSKSAEQ